MVILTTQQSHPAATKQRHQPVAARALDVHEVAVGVLDQSLQLVLSKQLTLTVELNFTFNKDSPLLLGGEGMEQILSKRHLYSSES